jgi:LacI family transcriptional regulator
MRATRADVARKARVSVATVSYVLNNTCPVKEETRNKVLAAVSSLNYIPDLRARSMATNRTMQIAVIVASLINPVYCEIVDCFIHRAALNNYFVTISTRIGSMLQNIRNVISQHVDGVFVLSMPDELEADMINDLVNTEIRTIVGVPITEASIRQQVCSIDMAWDNVFLKALNFLKSYGHDRIAYIGNIASSFTEQKLIQIYGKIAEREKTDVEFFIDSDFYKTDYEAGLALGRKLMNRYDYACTAVLASSDEEAKGCADVFLDSGLNVPDDISIMAIKNRSSMPASLKLPITTMSINYRDFAERAFDMLQDSIDGNLISHYKMPSFLLPGKTVKRREGRV